MQNISIEQLLSNEISILEKRLQTAIQQEQMNARVRLDQVLANMRKKMKNALRKQKKIYNKRLENLSSHIDAMCNDLNSLMAHASRERGFYS